MQKAIKFLLILVFSSVNTLKGQDYDSLRLSLAYPVYSQYLQNGLMINPAYAGSREALSTFLSYRMQWIGTSGAPQMQTAALHSPMKNDRVALGLKAQFMSYGSTRAANAYLIYAYHLKMGKGKLSFGLKAGADFANTDYSGLSLVDSDDEVFLAENKPLVLPNTGAGIYYFSDRFFAGLSVPEFMSYRRTSAGGTQAYHSFSEYDFVVSAGGLITFSDAFKFKPSVMAEYSLEKSKGFNQLDISGNFIFADLLWIGGSWRTTEEVAVGIIQILPTPQLMIGFSYDYPVGMLNTFSKGSSEITLRYEFGSKVSAANPRYF